MTEQMEIAYQFLSILKSSTEVNLFHDKYSYLKNEMLISAIISAHE